MERAFFRSGNQWLVLEEPVAELIAERPAEVPGILSEVDAAVEDNGLFAAGFVSYEAAAAYGLSVHDPLPGRLRKSTSRGPHGAPAMPGNRSYRLMPTPPPSHLSSATSRSGTATR